MGLQNISKIDGRYAKYTEELDFSEYDLIKNRMKAEVRHLVKLSELDQYPLDIYEDDKEYFRDIIQEWDMEKAKRVKEIEKKTNHDVKAVERFLQEKAKEENLERVIPHIHMGMTSEDPTNIAYSLMFKDALEDNIMPQLLKIGYKLADMTKEYSDTPMLGHTHGKEATPTTVGKEFGVYLEKLSDELVDLIDLNENISGKFGGATGSLASLKATYPEKEFEIDWMEYSKNYVESFGLKHNPITEQINNREHFTNTFDKLAEINNILFDLDDDMWHYCWQHYFKLDKDDDEVGSSTMPQKVNPIDFENGKGNLSKTEDEFHSLNEQIQIVIMQRDLHDSTIMRDIGANLGKALVGYKKTMKGLKKIAPWEENLEQDLEDNPQVLAEAFQTMMRRNGNPDAYKVIKDATRGKENKLTLEELHEIVKEQNLPDDMERKLLELKPKDYTGYAARMAKESYKRNIEKLDKVKEFLENK